MSDELERLSQEVAQLRATHNREPLDLDDLNPDPLLQFADWMRDALEEHPDWPNAVALATADGAGHPSVRMLLLKGVDETGFVFHTNKLSRKGKELKANPRAALVFYWPGLERQVRVTGDIQELSAAESDEYFATRPLASKLGAWASRQSEVLESRAALEAEVERYRERFGEDVPRPDHWGGFRLVPVEIEFWRSQPDRLHDRFLYRRTSEGWAAVRLYP